MRDAEELLSNVVTPNILPKVFLHYFDCGRENWIDWINIVRGGYYVSSDSDQWERPTVENAVRYLAPEAMTPVIAAALMVAQWHPQKDITRGGRGYAKIPAFCLLYRDASLPSPECCETCPLAIKDQPCGFGNSLWDRWTRARGETLEEANLTDALFLILYDIYIEEYKKVLLIELLEVLPKSKGADHDRIENAIYLLQKDLGLKPIKRKRTWVREEECTVDKALCTIYKLLSRYGKQKA